MSTTGFLLFLVSIITSGSWKDTISFSVIRIHPRFFRRVLAQIMIERGSLYMGVKLENGGEWGFR